MMALLTRVSSALLAVQLFTITEKIVASPDSGI